MDFDRQFNHFRRHIDSLFDDFDRSFYRNDPYLIASLASPEHDQTSPMTIMPGDKATAMSTRDNSGRNAVGGYKGSMMMAPPSMKVDVIEEPNAYVVQAELPGINKDDVKLTVENDVLTISAERKNEVKEEDKNKRYVRMERSYGAVSRSLRLPPGCDPSKIAAKHENGVLKVSVPRNPNMTATKAIQIQ